MNTMQNQLKAVKQNQHFRQTKQLRILHKTKNNLFSSSQNNINNKHPDYGSYASQIITNTKTFDFGHGYSNQSLSINPPSKRTSSCMVSTKAKAAAHLGPTLTRAYNGEDAYALSKIIVPQVQQAKVVITDSTGRTLAGCPTIVAATNHLSQHFVNSMIVDRAIKNNDPLLNTGCFIRKANEGETVGVTELGRSILPYNSRCQEWDTPEEEIVPSFVITDNNGNTLAGHNVKLTAAKHFKRRTQFITNGLNHSQKKLANTECLVRKGKQGDTVGVTALGLKVLPYNEDGNPWDTLKQPTNVSGRVTWDIAQSRLKSTSESIASNSIVSANSIFSSSKYATISIPAEQPAARKKPNAAKPKPTNEEDADSSDEEGCTDEYVNNAGGDLQWVTTRVYSMEEVSGKKRMKIMCEGGVESNEKCPLVACVKWVEMDSNGPTGVEWNGCLRCQQCDMGGWDVKDERFPIKEMSYEHRQAILANCGVEGEEYKMPFSSPGKRKRDE